MRERGMGISLREEAVVERDGHARAVRRAAARVAGTTVVRVPAVRPSRDWSRVGLIPDSWIFLGGIGRARRATKTGEDVDRGAAGL
jgi:hypothetical protein